MDALKRTYMRVSRPTQRVRRRFLDEGGKFSAIRIIQIHWLCSSPLQIAPSRMHCTRINLRCAYRSSIRENIDYRVRDAEPVVDRSWHAEVNHLEIVVEVKSPGSVMSTGIIDHPSSSPDYHSAPTRSNPFSLVPHLL